jgi:hypothetical protein
MSLVGVAGCSFGPAPSNPLPVNPALAMAEVENPLFVPQGAEKSAYELVFNRVYDVVDKHFDISSSNRFAGVIETWPLITGGYADFFRLRCYDHYENLESTFQTVRRRAVVLITPAEMEGFYVEVRVIKELEDLAQPVHAGTGAAVFRTENPSERPFEVADPLFGSRGWIPLGQDHAFEQMILSELKFGDWPAPTPP